MNECKWLTECMNVWITVQIYNWKYQWISEYINDWENAWMDVWVDKHIPGEMTQWTYDSFN